MNLSGNKLFPKSSTYDGKIAGLYDMEETLGKGHFATVKLARHVFTGEKVAVKVIDKTKLDEVSRAHLVQEVRCTKLVQHPNVVRLYEVIDTQTKLYLILELGDGGDMYDYIMRHENKGLNEEMARKYFQQIVQAISYCHRLHVCHRDLKPENVVFFEKLGMVKLTDFGFSNRFNPGQKLETSCGSLAYSAPEILLGDSYDAPAVDVWSLGVILFMLVCGRAPFQEANDSETLTMIMDCKYIIPKHVSEGCRSLIERMLVRDPDQRASLEEIANDPWLAQGGVLIQPGDYLPLVSKEHLSEEDHNLIIQKMVNGSIATKEDILDALDRNEYNHITATYFLLAERKLRAQRQEQAQMINRGEFRPDMSPMSPCLPMPDSCELKSPFRFGMDSQPTTSTFTTANQNVADTLFSISAEGLLMIPGQLEAARLRKCSIVTEEEEEDGSGSDGSKISLSLSISGQRNKMQPMILELQPVDELQPPAPFPTTSKLGLRRRGSASPSTTPESECRGRPPMSPISTPSSPSPPAPASPSTNKPLPPHPSSRRLHTVQSSPQLTLREIFEEGEWEVFPDKQITDAAVSPAVLRRYEQRRKKSVKHRTASCSSSDASDDDSDPRKKHKHKFKGTNSTPRITMTRRDSYDDSSDSQEQGGSKTIGRIDWLSTNAGGTRQQGSNSNGNSNGQGSAPLGRRHSVSPFREKVMETRLRESQSLNRISEIDQLEDNNNGEASGSTLQPPCPLTPHKNFQPGRLPRIISQSDCSGEEEKENEQTPIVPIEAVNVYVNGGSHFCVKDKVRKNKTKNKFSKYFELRKARFSFPLLKSRLYKAHSCGSLKESQPGRVSADINQNSNDRGKNTPTAPPSTPTANGRPLSTVSATSNGVLELEGVSKRCSLC